MPTRGLKIGILLLTLAARGGAGTIRGTVSIGKKLTRQSVTPTVSLYQRGPSVPLGADADQDPVALERTRVVVYLEGPGPSAPVPGSVEQVNRRFAPDLLVVPAGSTVAFPNMDAVFHNVFSLSRTKSFDLGNYPKGASRSVTFSKPGIVQVDCRLHPNMAATIVVTPNRWYALADARGDFTLTDVPPGTYTIVAWHKAVGFIRKKIHVEAGAEAGVDFALPAAAGSSVDMGTR